jgi:hypothetical protein
VAKAIFLLATLMGVSTNCLAINISGFAFR